VLLVTGIASPKQMEEDLLKYTPHVELLAFGDHHDFTQNDIKLISKQFNSLPAEKRIIITTEKDAGRLRNIAFPDDELKKNMFYLPIEIEFLQNQQESFNQNITGYVRKNKRNSILSKRKNAI